MDFIIRNVEEKDLKEIAELCINDWKKAYRGFIDDDYLDSLDANEKYERYKKNYKEGHFIVAANEKKVLGFCRYSDDYIDGPYEDRADCELCALYVNFDDRNLGVGRAIVDFVKNYFRSIGKSKMIIWCFEDNKNGRGFYEKMGGQAIGFKVVVKGGKEYREIGYLYDL